MQQVVSERMHARRGDVRIPLQIKCRVEVLLAQEHAPGEKWRIAALLTLWRGSSGSPNRVCWQRINANERKFLSAFIRVHSRPALRVCSTFGSSRLYLRSPFGHCATGPTLSSPPPVGEARWSIAFAAWPGRNRLD